MNHRRGLITWALGVAVLLGACAPAANPPVQSPGTSPSPTISPSPSP